MSALPQVLTTNHILAKAREAYLAKTLSAQGPNPACLYRDDDGRPCIIGAALEPTVVQALVDRKLNLCNIGSLTTLHSEQSKDILKFDSESTRVCAINLQDAHDRWASLMSVNPRPNSPAENQVRTLLGLPTSA